MLNVIQMEQVTITSVARYEIKYRYFSSRPLLCDWDLSVVFVSPSVTLSIAGHYYIHSGAFYDKYLQHIKLNTEFVPFSKLDLSYLNKVGFCQSLDIVVKGTLTSDINIYDLFFMKLMTLCMSHYFALGH